jgi:hypothetical protein
MTKPRQPMTLRAHPNVASLEDERRAREQSDQAEYVMFVEFSAAEPETPPAAAPERRPRPSLAQEPPGAQQALAALLGPSGTRPEREPRHSF